MNFKNRLEAIRWLVNNLGERVHFDHPNLVGYPYISLRENGHWATSHGVDYFDAGSATRFRTTPDYVPDPQPEPEFEWPHSCRGDPLDPCSDVTRWYLDKYHDALIEFLDKRYVRK